MASFRDLYFTPAEFASLAKIDKHQIPELESKGLIKIIRKKIGNVDRKMMSLEDIQNYFHKVRDLSQEVPEQSGVGRDGDQNNAHSQAGAQTQDMAPSNIPNLSHLEEKASTGRFFFVPPKHKTQMFYNVKGGTGKSTLTAQYVMRAAMTGLKVLAIDLDGQGHLSLNLDVLDAHERPTIYDILINDLRVQDAIMNIAPGLDLIPANLGLCNIEIPLNLKPRREYRLSEAIAQVADQYDLIVADTNPAASILNSSMLVSASLVNIVCATNPLSFHGMSLVMTTIEELRKEFRKNLEVRVIPNMYDSREVISQEVLGELKNQFPEFCTKTVIHRSSDINEATKQRTSVWSVNSKGVGAKDINSLTEELLVTS